jgi:hypothetical protein
MTAATKHLVHFEIPGSIKSSVEFLPESCILNMAGGRVIKFTYVLYISGGT